jgi:hypothetical protein
MSYPEEWLAVVWSARNIPGVLGLRPHSVSIVNTAWTGDHTGDGARYSEVTPIVESGGYPPKVRWMKDDEIAVGDLPKGTAEIGPITPSFSGGGLDLAGVDGSELLKGETRQLLITGPQHPEGALYRVTNIKSERALHYMLRAEPRTQA